MLLSSFVSLMPDVFFAAFTFMDLISHVEDSSDVLLYLNTMRIFLPLNSSRLMSPDSTNVQLLPFGHVMPLSTVVLPSHTTSTFNGVEGD